MFMGLLVYVVYVTEGDQLSRVPLSLYPLWDYGRKLRLDGRDLIPTPTPVPGSGRDPY